MHPGPCVRSKHVPVSRGKVARVPSVQENHDESRSPRSLRQISRYGFQRLRRSLPSAGARFAHVQEQTVRFDCRELWPLIALKVDDMIPLLTSPLPRSAWSPNGSRVEDDRRRADGSCGTRLEVSGRNIVCEAREADFPNRTLYP